MPSTEKISVGTAWVLAAFGLSQVIILAPPRRLLRGATAEDTPAADTDAFFAIVGPRVVRGLNPFQGLYLRVPYGPPVDVIIHDADQPGASIFGPSPFLIMGAGATTISLPPDPQQVDGGAPDTDFALLRTIDCGQPEAATPAARLIDARPKGETP